MAKVAFATGTPVVGCIEKKIVNGLNTIERNNLFIRELWIEKSVVRNKYFVLLQNKYK